MTENITTKVQNFFKTKKIYSIRRLPKDFKLEYGTDEQNFNYTILISPTSPGFNSRKREDLDIDWDTIEILTDLFYINKPDFGKSIKFFNNDELSVSPDGYIYIVYNNFIKRRILIGYVERLCTNLAYLTLYRDNPFVDYIKLADKRLQNIDQNNIEGYFN